MSRKSTNTNRLIIVSPLIAELGAEYLINACRQLAALREFESLGRVAKMIQSPIGRYYEALASKAGGGNPEFNIAGLPDKDKARVLISIAQGFRARGDVGYAARIALESHRLAIRHGDRFTLGNAQRELAVSLSVVGDHRQALRLLESAAPSALDLNPYDVAAAAHFADYHNSIAVELFELGRTREARRAVSVALASPFAHAYPEWRETSQAIERLEGQPSRKLVTVALPVLPASNVVYLPERAPGSGSSTATSMPANVLTFTPMANDKKTVEEDDSAAIRQALRREIFDLITDEDVRDQIPRETLQEMVRIAREGLKKQGTKK